MSNVTEAFRAHHRELANELSEYVAALTQPDSESKAQGLADFLKRELVPHAAGEEQHLYPVVEELLRSYGKPTATMSIDHEYIQSYVNRIDRAVRELDTTEPGRQNAIRTRIAQLGLELKAIFDLHMSKEERVYLPLLEQYVPEQAQQRMLEAMHEPSPAISAETLDVRSIVPMRRHTLIFQTFDALPQGKAFELVNDHDPKPLYYQFAAELPDTFTWDYIERGPSVWRVRIGKTKAARPAAVPGGVG
jgi:uncharacterized protein (DUF2249 family)